MYKTVCREKSKLLPVSQEGKPCTVTALPSTRHCRFTIFSPVVTHWYANASRQSTHSNAHLAAKGCAMRWVSLFTAHLCFFQWWNPSSTSSAARNRCLTCTPDFCGSWLIWVCCTCSLFCSTTGTTCMQPEHHSANSLHLAQPEHGGAGSGRQVFQFWPLQSLMQRQYMSRGTPTTTSASFALQWVVIFSISSVPAGGQPHILHLWSCEHILVAIPVSKK